MSSAVSASPRGRKPPGNHLLRNVGIVLVVAIVAVAGVTLALTHPPHPASSQVTVLATFYPVYDFARNVGGDRVNVSLLVPMTVDVHAFEPSPSSVAAVANARVLLYSGAGLEPWIPAIVSAADNPGLIEVDSSHGVSLLPVAAQYQQNGRTVDPHIWLDPVLAKQQVENILNGLIQADPADAAYFTANADNYTAKLDLLNSEAINLSAHAVTRDFVTFHEAFGYFAQQYNLTQIPIAGPFEEDPTPTDIQNVIDAIHAHRLCYVGYESLENPAIAQGIASQTNATLILMDPIEGLSPTDQSLGATYLTKMQADFDSFSLALNHVGCT